MPNTSRDQAASVDTPSECDRRHATRILSGKHANCRATRGCDQVPVQIKDVSRCGLALLSRCRFELGTVLMLESCEDNGQPVFVLTRVVRLVSLAGGHWLVGCSAVGEISEDEFESLRPRESAPVDDGRRTSVRIPEIRVATCRRDTPGSLRRWIVEVRDLSEAGVGLIIPCEIEEGARLRIVLSEREEHPMDILVARVIRRNLQPDGRWLLCCVIVPSQSKLTAV